jgi:hypothetical protein
MAHLAARGEGREARVAVVRCRRLKRCGAPPHAVVVGPVRPGIGEDWWYGAECRGW